MRDDQIRNLIKIELAHADNVSLLRSQQNKIRIDSIVTAACEPMNIIKCLWKPFFFMEKVEEIYEIKAAEFNDRMKEAMSKKRFQI